MQPAKNLSSFELQLLGELQAEERIHAPLRAGEVCPQCGEGRLDYNGVLALECPLCGYTSGEGGGCT